MTIECKTTIKGIADSLRAQRRQWAIDQACLRVWSDGQKGTNDCMTYMAYHGRDVGYIAADVRKEFNKIMATSRAAVS